MRKKFLFHDVTKTKRGFRRRNSNEEHETQVSLIKWIEFNFPNALFCASAGGMRTNIRTASKMKAAGYRKGFPDLFFYEPRRGFKGLAIELKKEEGGKVSDSQKMWIEKLNARGYYASVCEGFNEATATIEAYFNENKLLKCD